MKYYMSRLLLMLFIAVLAFSCANENKRDQENEGEMVDSVLVEVLEQVDTLESSPSPVVPELLGTWVVVEMRLDDNPLSQDDIGQLVYTFDDNGKMVFDSKDQNDDFEAESFSYTYDQNVIKTPHFPLGEARITELNNERLEFIIEAAGSEVKYILNKQ